MKVSYEYDQDPRYGWCHIDTEGQTQVDIVVQDHEGLCHGFSFCDGEMTKVCICSAWSESECSCIGSDWS